MINKTISLAAILLLVATGQSALAEKYDEEGQNCFAGDPASGACPVLTGTPKFVKENFSFNLSSGVELQTFENDSAIVVNARHDDGLYRFGGSSEGGSVGKCDTQKRVPPTEWTVYTPTAVTILTGGCPDTASSP